MRDAATDVAEEPLTYQEARRRDRVDRAAVVVESAEGERFVPENSGDAWSEERQKEPRLAATTDARTLGRAATIGHTFQGSARADRSILLAANVADHWLARM